MAAVTEPIREAQKLEEIKRLLRSEKNPRDYLLFVLGINTALRISDLLALKVKDILDERGTNNEFLYLTERKTKRARKIRLNASVQEAFNHYFSKTKIRSREQLLFLSRTGKPLDRTAAWLRVRKWCQDVGLGPEHYGTHSLRKTWGYRARLAGIDMELIREKLGHRAASVTRRYIGITEDEINGVEDKVLL